MSNSIKNKKKRIFLLGSYHGNNFGDLEILDTLVNKLYRDFNLTILTRSSFKIKSKLTPQYFEDGNIDFVNPFNILKIFSTILKSQIVLIGGGGLFFSYSFWDTLRMNGQSQLLYWIETTIFSKLMGKKVYWFGVGFGPFDKFGEILVAIGAKFIDKAFVRDSVSFSHLQKHVSKNKLIQTSDLVFSKVESRKIKKNIEKKTDEIKQVLLVIFNKGNSQRLEDLIRDLKSNGYKITITSTNPEKDKNFNFQLASKTDLNYLDTSNFSIFEFRNMFNKYDLVISMRMHALLIGYQQGVVGIGLSDGIPKVKEIQNQLYINSFGTIEFPMHSSSYKLSETLRILNKNQYDIKKNSIKNYEDNYKLAEQAFKDWLNEISSK